MPDNRFSSDEIARFAARFEGLAEWSRWHRRDGIHGEDVLELIDRDGRTTLKVARSEDCYVATGFAGWGLTVCDSFDELLEILSTYRPRCRPAAVDERSRAA